MNSESGKEIATLMHNAANRIAVAQNQIRKIKTALPLNRTTAESKKDIESWLEILNAEMDQLAEIQRAVNTSLLKSADHPDARFEEHYNRSIDLICVAGTDACFKHVNPAFHRLLGYTNDELLSKPFLDFIHPDDLPGTLAEVAKLAEGAKTLHFENRYRTKAGDFKTLSWVSEIDLKTGNIYAIARDVTALRTSEERFRQLISTLNKTAIVAFTDAKGVILEINDGFCKISGYSPEELIGNDHRLINSGAHSKTFFENMWETIAAGTIWVGDIQNRRKDGGFYWVRTTICPLLNNYGVLESYVAIKFDITQQKIAEQLGQELREQLEASLEISQNAERGFRVIFENSPIGILQTDARLLLKFVNAAFLKFIGWPEQDMSIVSLLHFCHADDSPKLLQYIAQANQDGKAPDAPPLTLRFNHKSGNAVTGRLTARKIPLQGEEPYLLLVIEDITDAQLQETALLKAKTDLEAGRLVAMRNAKLASLGEISAGIAHEINNPLMIIYGSVRSMLKFENDKAQQTRKLETIQRASERIAKIVGGLKKFSRTSDPIEYSSHSLEAIINESVTLTTAKANQNTTPILIECDVVPNINCDEVEIEQVLINLISNSIDALEDKEEKWIKIRLFATDSSINLQIEDSGNGISEEVAGKIFQPFFTTKPVGKGTGLGLSISKGILEEHKATIEIIDGPHTCFEIRFPKVVDTANDS